MEISIPEPTPKKYTEFPAPYRNLNHLPEYVKDLRSIRENSFFNETYMATWDGLLMCIDRKNYPKLTEPLIEALNQGHGEGQSGVEQGWEKLRSVSAYPIFSKINDELISGNYGFKVISKWKRENSDVGSNYVPGFEAASDIFSNIYDYRLLSRAHSSFGSKLRAVNKALVNKGREDLVGYTAALYLLDVSRDISHGVIFTVMNQWANPDLVIKLPQGTEEYLSRLLKQTEIYRCFSTIFGKKINQKEEEVFGEDANIAGALWRAALFVRNKAPKKMLMSFRKDMINLLINKEYDKARFRVEELAAFYPESMPKFVEEQLDIEPKVLNELMIEEDLIQKKEKEEKMGEVREKRRELVEKARLLVGKNLVSSDGKVSVRIRFNSKKIQTFHVTPNYGVDFIRKEGIRISPQDLLALAEIYNLKPQLNGDDYQT